MKKNKKKKKREDEAGLHMAFLETWLHMDHMWMCG